VPADVMSPSQTIGPLYGFALMFEGSNATVDPGSAEAIRIEGRILDGAGEPVSYPEGMIEVWAGDQWARGRTDEEGRYRFVVRKPERVALPDARLQAPHLNVSVFARGLLKQAQTRIYFPDEARANAEDPVLERVPEGDRDTLLAREEGGVLTFDVHLQGRRETVFFDF
jgi:protocatechuate 3,4-dioxygenase, alpha subunit